MIRVLSYEALISRVGFWGPLYYKYNKEPPKNSIGNYLVAYITIGVPEFTYSVGFRVPESAYLTVLTVYESSMT